MLETGEGAFAGRAEAGVVAVVLLVVLGQFAVSVVGGANGGAGALVGAVGQDEDLAGQAGLDDAVGAGRGQVVGPSRSCPGELQRSSVRRGDDLDVHAVLPVLLRVVRLVRPDAVGGNQRTVDNDEVALAQAHQGLVQAGRPGG